MDFLQEDPRSRHSRWLRHVPNISSKACRIDACVHAYIPWRAHLWCGHLTVCTCTHPFLNTGISSACIFGAHITPACASLAHARRGGACMFWTHTKEATRAF